MTLRKAAPGDVGTLAAVLARAFYDDPPFVWLLPAPGTRLARLTLLFTALAGIEALPYGGVDLAREGADIAGGAVWLPPGRREAGPARKARAAPLHWRAVAGAEIRAARMGHALSRARPAAPHWYLKAVAVDPARQGRGVASRLLRSRLERCDRSGMPAYLEASKPEGIGVYERFGFRVTGTVALPPGAPVVTAMWRDPAR